MNLPDLFNRSLTGGSAVVPGEAAAHQESNTTVYSFGVTRKLNLDKNSVYVKRFILIFKSLDKNIIFHPVFKLR